MSAIPTSPVELLGVTLCGPPPLGRIHLSLDESLRVLYGKNGAGKTRILQALEAALSGVASTEGWGFLHIRLADPAELYGGWCESLRGAVMRHSDEVHGSVIALLAEKKEHLSDKSAGSDDEYGSVFETMEAFSAAAIENDFRPYAINESIRALAVAADIRLTEGMSKVGPLHAYADGSLISEVADSGELVLVAAGRADESKWRVFAAASPGDAVAGPLIAEYRDIWEALRQDNSALESGSSELEELSHKLKLAVHGFPWAALTELSHPFIDGSMPTLDVQERFVAPSTVFGGWPSWASVPLYEVAEIREPLVSVSSLSKNFEAVQQQTNDALLAAVDGNIISGVIDDEVEFEPNAVKFASEVSRLSSTIFHRVLPDSPELVFDIPHPNLWALGTLPSWQAVLPAAKLPLESLSSAEKKWALIACALALQKLRPTAQYSVFLCDEPEAGLHRRAEADLSEALLKVARDTGSIVVAATHSPAMLDTNRAALTHVTRNADGATLAYPMDFSIGDSLDVELAASELGLSLADLLQLVRCFVFVEGSHDEVVLKSLLADDLRAGSKIYSMRGAKQLNSLATARLVWDFTDAAVVIVLDNVARKKVEPIWHRAMDLSAAGKIGDARKELYSLEKLPGSEPKWLREFLELVIKNNRQDRIRLETLSQPDIICYLPVEEFVPNKTWEELISEWKKHHKLNGEKPNDLKGFLRTEYGAKTNIAAFKRATVNAEPNEELQAVGLRLRELGAFGPYRRTEPNHGESL